MGGEERRGTGSWSWSWSWREGGKGGGVWGDSVVVSKSCPHTSQGSIVCIYEFNELHTVRKGYDN